MATNTTNTNKVTKFNPTITAFFEDSRFGEGALKSANIDAEAFKAIQQNVSTGVSLLLRKSPKLNKNGNATYFLEVLPALAGENPNKYGKKNNTNTDSDI